MKIINPSGPIKEGEFREKSKTHAGGRRIWREGHSSSQVSKVGGLKFFTGFRGGLYFLQKNIELFKKDNLKCT